MYVITDDLSKCNLKTVNYKTVIELKKGIFHMGLKVVNTFYHFSKS